MSEPRVWFAKDYTVSMRDGLRIDGVPFRWAIPLDPGLLVEPIDEHRHLLWIPVMVEKPIPEYGRPDGIEVPVDFEPAPQPESADDEGGAA
jgi:hypothetical protein